jgi:hypothetical protein
VKNRRRELLIQNENITSSAVFQDIHLNPPSNSRNDLLFQDTNLNKTSREIGNNNSINFPNDKFSDVESRATQSIQELEEIPTARDGASTSELLDIQKRILTWLKNNQNTSSQESKNKAYEKLGLKENTQHISLQFSKKK